MKHRLSTYFHQIHYILLCTIILGMMVVAPSCSGSKRSASMRKIDKEAKRDYRSKEEKKADAEREKKEKARKKEEEKTYSEALKQHRSLQSEEMLRKMDYDLSVSNKQYSKKKEFFLVRWFRPKDDIEKIEKRRAKEVQKRMAATQKKADKNNEERGATYFKGKERKVAKPKPSDYQHGGGGTYVEGKAGGVDPSTIQHGGGGTYKEGKSRSKVSASDIQHGGGGSYQPGKSKSKARASDTQHGGGGSYQAGKSNSSVKPSSIQHGGGGNISSGSSKKVKVSSDVGPTKGTSPRKNPFSKKKKPKAGD